MPDPRNTEAESDRDPRLDQAARLVARARRFLANGELAMSARPLLFGVDGVYPQFVAGADGCRLEDTTGRSCIDWLMGWGSALLGYGRPEIEAAVGAQHVAAATLSLPHSLEVDVAEALVDLVPCAEMVAFGKNGSDAVTAAVRLARAHTERDLILHYGFHGFHDWFTTTPMPARGVPTAFGGLVKSFPYNDLDALRRLFEDHKGQVAAVLMEPFRHELPLPDYLTQVRELAHQNGALLIFDEMVTGFRISPGGAQALFNVPPDLACFGKALANGMPLAALVGPRELMRDANSVGVDMTCRGETRSLAAAQTALSIYASEPVAERVAETGRQIKFGIERAAAAAGVPLRLQGHPARLEITFAEQSRLPATTALGLFIQGCMERGVLLNGLFLPSMAHDLEAIETTIEAATQALRIVAAAASGDRASLPPPFGPASIGFLDSAEVVDGVVRLAGWLLPRGRTPDSVELVDSEGRTAAAALGSRLDVAGAYSDVAGADRCGWSVEMAVSPAAKIPSWTLRAYRDGDVACRVRLVAGCRDYKRSFPRELGDGHVVEF